MIQDFNCFVGNTIYLRLFEESDFENTYLWRNDFELQVMTAGPIRFVSKEIEKEWVVSKSKSNAKELYLAICAKENGKMIGYYSVTDIDLLNRSCHCGGILIGDKDYRDGVAYLEVHHLVHRFLFQQLNMHRISGACLREHIISRAHMEASNWKLEGIKRDAIFKNGCYHDIFEYSLLDCEYQQFIQNPISQADYIKRFVAISKQIKKQS